MSDKIIGVDIDKLEALAKAALEIDTDWYSDDSPGFIAGRVESYDTEFIAAANPKAVIELLEILDRWRRFCAEYEQRLQAVYVEKAALTAAAVEALDGWEKHAEGVALGHYGPSAAKAFRQCERIAELRKLITP